MDILMAAAKVVHLVVILVDEMDFGMVNLTVVMMVYLRVEWKDEQMEFQLAVLKVGVRELKKVDWKVEKWVI